MRICLSAPNTLGYPDGGHVWVFLNWALGFLLLGHEVIWLDVVESHDSPERVTQMLAIMRDRLRPFGLDQSIALCTPAGNAYEHERRLELVPLDRALACNVLCDHRYNLPEKVVAPFRRSMMIDIDPGQFHVALDLGTYHTAPHTHYFTVGEWVKFTANPPFNTHGRDWIYTPPPVALDQWPVTPADPAAPLTTISNWYMHNEWMPDGQGDWYDNSKRAAFQPFLDVPQRSPIPLELCLNIGHYQPEIDLLESKGWRVRKSPTISHPVEYRRYIQQSRGEFSCAKPAYQRLQTGWLSDRTACYLASGKPAVIQKTGPSDFLDAGEGVLRFTTPGEAVAMLQHVHAHYASHAAAARRLAEDHLDAKKVLMRALEQTM